MLTQRADDAANVTRRDAGRLIVAVLVLMGALTAILAIDFLPSGPVVYQPGDLADTDIRAPRALDFTSEILTEQARQDARNAVEPQYDYTPERGIAAAADAIRAFNGLVSIIDSAFEPDVDPELRVIRLRNVTLDLSANARATLIDLEPERWASVRAEAARVLDATERQPLRDSDVAATRESLIGRIGGGLSSPEAMLATELISPLLVPNSSFSQGLTDLARADAAAAVEPVTEAILAGEIIVREGTRLTDVDLEKLAAFGLDEARPDVARIGGWAVMSALVVAVLLAWILRFRREFWHRNNVLLLLAVLLVFITIALTLAAGRAALPFVLPIAAVGMLVAILLDGATATILIAILAILGGASSDRSLELTVYIFLGGLAGIIAVRRGDTLQRFLQAGVAVAIVQALVVSAFSLLGERDLTGIVQLWGASLISAGGSTVAAVGLFAVVGNLFGILTVFQLLELANPTQPILRRLLVETPGTYHHSLMVGNLAERAAESVGADPLLTRVAAYYHDIGKLGNPAGFIENQAGGENIHDQLEPEVSAQILKQHVVDGIDLAYRARLPKALIAFIPQHHGTMKITYFLQRAREQAAEPFGGLGTPEGARAADAIDVSRFRHSGPKPQSKEAALIMLADSVEASVRSLESRDEPTIRAMVRRIVNERLADRQFDDCDLTLRDLETIQDAFVGQLLGMYHQRIAYPQNAAVEQEARRQTAAAAGGEDPAAASPDGAPSSPDGAPSSPDGAAAASPDGAPSSPDWAPSSRHRVTADEPGPPDAGGPSR
jgi:hypothetical protein